MKYLLFGMFALLTAALLFFSLSEAGSHSPPTAPGAFVVNEIPHSQSTLEKDYNGRTDGESARKVVVDKEAEVADEDDIPKKYVLPNFPIGMTTGGFMEAYWGNEWQEIEAYILSSQMASNLANINSKDWNEGMPIGTIDDFFTGLKERALKQFEETYRGIIHEIPGVDYGTYLDDSNYLAQTLRGSSLYNPQGKVLDLQHIASLALLITENSVVPRLLSEDVYIRWRQLISEDIDRITAYGDPVHGKSFISPLMSAAFNTQPDVFTTKPYPVMDVYLPGADRAETQTAAGFFSGWLTIWSGTDPSLVHNYQELATQNEIFQKELKEFFVGI